MGLLRMLACDFDPCDVWGMSDAPDIRPAAKRLMASFSRVRVGTASPPRSLVDHISVTSPVYAEGVVVRMDCGLPLAQMQAQRADSETHSTARRASMSGLPR